MNFKNKNVLVMGLGLHGGGVGTIRFLAQKGANLTVTDLRSRKILAPSLKNLRNIRHIRYVLGRHREKDILQVDLIIKNPGVKPDSPYLALARRRNIPITTDLGIFFKSCPAPIIGVTGTRGKSTTAHLITEFLRRGTKKQIFLGGNIRKSVLGFLGKIKTSDLAVLELSSFQLEDMRREKISPHIAVFTNIYRDHLNWHKDMADYLRAKSYIFAFQSARDYLVANPSDRKVGKLAKTSKSKVIFPSLDKKFKEIVDEKFGAHYESSVALAISVARLFKVSENIIKKTLQGFRGLEGRQQNVARIRGVRFINDTTATIPDAAIAAMKRFQKHARNLILITGGQDKKLQFGEMIMALKKFPDYIIFLPGTATDRIQIQKSRFGGFPPTVEVKNMKEAVRAAFKGARAGDIVLLSPGAASFGLFLNEFDRGAQFVKEVKKHVFRR